VNSLISLYYYLMVIKEAYLGQAVALSRPQEAISEPTPASDRPTTEIALPVVQGAALEAAEQAWRVPLTLQALSLAFFLAIVLLGVYPGPLVAAIGLLEEDCLGDRLS
jgi:NADH:ubiquinone oxidoreductase subunit 2 (subunit N)